MSNDVFDEVRAVFESGYFDVGEDVCVDDVNVDVVMEKDMEIKVKK